MKKIFLLIFLLGSLAISIIYALAYYEPKISFLPEFLNKGKIEQPLAPPPIEKIDKEIIALRMEEEKYPKFQGYIIQLKEKPVLEKKIEIEKYTPPKELPKKLKEQRDKITLEHQRFLRDLSAIIKYPQKKIRHEFKDIFNGFSMNVSKEEVEKIKKLKWVKEVYLNLEVKALLMDSVPLINADDVWNLKDDKGRDIKGEGITIAIIDTGIDYTHPDLGGCFGADCKVIDGYDFINDDADPMDDNGHGTHCAGIAAGNGILNGVAPEAKLYAYKVLDAKGRGSEDSVMAGIEASMDPNGDRDPSDHVDVISMSLGAICGFEYTTSCGPYDPMSQAIDNAVDNGVVAVIAAGNEDEEYGEANITSPGTAREAITVGATYKKDYIGEYWLDRDPKLGQITSFSSRGPVKWDTNYMEKPDVVAPGAIICSARYNEIFPERACLDSNHIQMAGTSMATPHVAGAVALLKQAHPQWTPTEIKSYLKNTAVDLGYDVNTQGGGLIDVFHANEINIEVPIPEIKTAGIVKGMIDIRGDLIAENFESYTLEYKPATDQSNWIQITTSNTLPTSDLLFENWDTSLLSDGPYFLRLIETFTGGKSNYDESLITIDNIYISSPKSGDWVSREVKVKGTATGTNFDYYKLEYASQDNPDVWFSIGVYYTKVIDDILATWNASSLDNGFYFLKLTVYNTDGHISEDKVLVRLDKELHQGFPVSMGDFLGGFLPTIADLDGDGYQEIIIRGGGAGKVHAYHQDGTKVNGWPQYLALGPFGWAFEAGASVGDIDGDGKPEVVSTWVEDTTPEPGQKHGSVWAWKANGTLIDGFPTINTLTTHGGYWSSAVLADLDKDGDLEIISTIILDETTTKVFALNQDGKIFPNWPSDEVYHRSPAIGDIDGDGELEVVALSNPWPKVYLYIFNTDGTIKSSFEITTCKSLIPTFPVLVDLDNDGDLEIGFSCWVYKTGRKPSKIIFVHHDGTLVAGWPYSLDDWVYGGISIGDVDGDGNVEIAFGEWAGSDSGPANLYLLNKDGTLRWSKTLEGAIMNQPVIGDINGDGKADILITTLVDSELKGRVYALDSNGQILDPFPKILSAGCGSGAAIGDIDKDGKVEVVAVAADGNIFSWDLEGSYDPVKMEWPMFQHDERHTGLYRYPILPGKKPSVSLDPSGKIERTAEDILGVTVSSTDDSGVDSLVLLYFDKRKKEWIEFHHYCNGAITCSHTWDFKLHLFNCSDSYDVWVFMAYAKDIAGQYSDWATPDLRVTVFSDGLCHEDCGSSPECEGKTLNSKWCDKDVLKICNLNCQYSQTNCSTVPGYTCRNEVCTCIGDINGDLKVDMADIGFVVDKFGCKCGMDCYDSLADLNGDCKIDMADIGLVVNSFGQYCTAFQPLAILFPSPPQITTALLASIAIKQISIPFLYFAGTLFIAWLLFLIYTRDPKKAFEKIFTIKFLIIIILITLLAIGIHHYGSIADLIISSILRSVRGF